MKRADCVIVRAWSWLTVHSAALLAGLAVVWMAAPSPARGQSSWPNYPNNTVIKITTDGKVGIGTTSPGSILHIRGTTPNLFIDSAGSSDASILRFLANGAIKWNVYRETNNTFNISEQGVRRILAADSGPSASLYLQPDGGNVGIGTTNPQYKLAVNGTVGAKEVIVTNTGWPDYVFRPGYRLRPLSDVGAYIRAHHHLPDIPSEAEVKEKGVSLGDMQARLLAKIEELTLYMIQQDKENRELRQRIAQLEARAAGVPSGPGALAAGRPATAVGRSIGSCRNREDHSEVARGKAE